MSTEILINASTHEARAAVVENGVLQEVFLERPSRRGLISNIYKGRVSRVLPGMQAAFIDIGLERTAFLHASDILDARHAGLGMEPPRNDSIRSLVAEGDEILVQVVKDPLGTKGARLTTYITLPSRYLVYMPKGQGVGVSARIEDEGERERLRSAVQSGIDAAENAGYIVRTAAEDAPAEALLSDMAYLRKLRELVRQKGLRTQPGNLVHADLPARLLKPKHPFWPLAGTERPPGGETFAEMIVRVGPALEGLADRRRGENVVAVSHGGAIRAAVAHCLRIEADNALHLSINNLSLTRLERHPDGWRVVCVNEMAGY